MVRALNISHLLSVYGYFGVFAVVGAESLGIPLPGETILVTAGIYAGTTHKLSVTAIFLVAAAAAITGDNIGFWVGSKGGYRILRRYGHYVRADEAKIKVGRLVFARHGPKVVFFGRFISVLRTYAAFLAGTLKMHWPRFLVFNALGGIIWAAIYSFVPYTVGNSIKKASGTADTILAGVAVIAVIAVVWVVHRKASQLEEEAEVAYPGPLPER